MRRLKTIEIKKVEINSSNYPKLLRHIPDAPKVLYVIGNMNLLKDENCVAIIGRRIPNGYGIKAARYFSYNLAKLGFTIVSGLALGIDSVAHKGALLANGKTIAVIGSGFYNLYPRTHKSLARQIVRRGGLLISEYPPETEIDANNFPARNRIISGLSKGLLVIEARKKSGSMITVEHALDQGREVMAVPRKH